ncbi:hypothetical protein BGZ99_004129 [Dissophora globulifera]|uniref:GSKIP domain-containing protein n=1 Tax=Dissophora globulifera TaxID=979702 RepID=A0A9P6RL42_9FUNG|nr:hypothetical protein BGZ99_004129 [Dissophora globulifera]
MVPDLTHYAQGLHPATFPVHVTTEQRPSESSLSAQFVVVLKELHRADVVLDGRGFRVVSLSPFAPEAAASSPTLIAAAGSLTAAPIAVAPTTTLPSAKQPSLSDRQQEALSGLAYETIEALLMALSPGFEEFFGQELSRKLGAISWDRLEQRYAASDESNNGDSDDEDKVYVIDNKLS